MNIEYSLTVPNIMVTSVVQFSRNGYKLGNLWSKIKGFLFFVSVNRHRIKLSKIGHSFRKKSGSEIVSNKKDVLLIWCFKRKYLLVRFKCFLTKYSNFLWVWWFLAHNLPNFVSLSWKLDNRCYHIQYWHTISYVQPPV